MRIISNTAISLDGKIASKTYDHVRLGSEMDLLEMSNIRNQADAILVGGNTYRNWPIALYGQKHTDAHPVFNVIVSRGVDVTFTPAFLGEKKIKPLLLTTSKETSQKFPIEVVYFNQALTPFAIVETLQARGVKTLLLESGGDLLFQFLENRLLHEMFVTLCPKILDGKSSPSLVDGQGFEANTMRNLRLITSHQIQSEIFLHYEVLPQ